MVTTAFPDTLAPRESSHSVDGPLLVATDGSDASDPAFAVAGEIAAHRFTDVRVLAVLEPLPILSSEPEAPPWARNLNAARRDEAMVRAKHQARQHQGASWNIDIREGSPPVEIARLARESQASLVVVGIGRHALKNRIFGDETVLQLLRLADVPVLAMPVGFTGRPHRAIFATDFSESSIRAFQSALHYLHDSATIYLLHVVPRFAHLTDLWEAMEETYTEGLGAAFARFRAALDVPDTMTVETVELRGNPATEALAFADAAKADLIVCGTHGHGFISRLLIGSVATHLLRGAKCPVLIIPQPDPSWAPELPVVREKPAAEFRTTELPRAEWADRLRAFTERNAGRDCRIEVDDPAIGAQAQVVDYPLLGVAFDRRDQRLEVMVGDPHGAHHLSRGIGGVTAVSLVVDDTGRDRVLQIAHGSGETMVLLEGAR